MLEPSSAGSPEGVVPVTEERLEVDRRTVETGAVRVRKRVHEHTEQVNEPLVSEFVESQRVPVGRVLHAPVGIRQEGDVTIVPVIQRARVLPALPRPPSFRTSLTLVLVT